MCAALCPHSSCHTSCHSSSADDTHNLQPWLSHQSSLVICRQHIQLNSLVIAPAVTCHPQTTHTTYRLGYHPSCDSPSADNAYNLTVWLLHQLLLIRRQCMQLEGLVITPVHSSTVTDRLQIAYRFAYHTCSHSTSEDKQIKGLTATHKLPLNILGQKPLQAKLVCHPSCFAILLTKQTP